MTKLSLTSNPKCRMCGLFTAAFLLCGTQYAAAQETAASPVAEAPVPADAAAAEGDVPPSAAGDIASEVAALKTEVAALKAKQEEAETAALLGSSDSAPAEEPETLRIYGFMDFGLDKGFYSTTDSAAVVKPTSATTFVFGNLNLYIDATPMEHLRCLTELRVTLAPHGEEIQLGPPVGTSYERINTTAFDFSSPSAQSQLRLGGLYVERAWSEYEFSKAFRVQAGLFLNPFGIWNLDHGSPTLISLMLPTFIAAQMVPTRLLGVHAYGSTFFGNSELGYALHVTNGRSPLDYDLSEDKAIGGRLFVANDGDYGRLVVGASGYWGTFLDQRREFNLSGAASNVALVDTVDYMEEVLGVDFALDIGGLRLRTEGVLRWIDYEDGKHEVALGTDGKTHFLPSRMEFSGYFLAAYRTPYRVEPYLAAETSVAKAATLPSWAGDSAWSSPNVSSVTLSGGLNVELTTHTQLKGQLAWIRAYDRHFKNKNNDYPILFVRLVNSF